MTASTANFFIAGGTLHTNAASYVTRQADRELYEALQSGMFAYVLTSRQMGKSSLMVRTARQFRSEGNLVAVVDMTALGQNATVEQWYFTLTECIARQLGSPSDKWEPLWNSAERSALQHWVQFIEQLVERSKHRIIIFIDEIDLVQTLPFSTDEFFAAIRQFYNRRPIEPKFERLTFCLLGVAAPSDLIRDPRLTPFNIGVRIELTDFSIDEAAVLASGLGDGSQAEARFRRVLYWTGGHPYLTQRLCQSLSTRNRDSDVDSTCANIYFGTRAREQDDNLLFVRERLIRSREDVPALLKLYSNVLRHKPVRDEEANPLVTELRLSGICKSRAGILSVRNRIYSHVFDNAWVKSSMPDAEVRRQRAAFRKGALLAGAVALAVILTITGLALTILRQRNENRWQLYIADISLAQQAWAHHNPYRAIELLEQHVPKSGDRDLRGFEWYMVRNLCSSRKPVHTIDVGDDAYVAVASPDASHVYAITVHGQLIDFDAASGTRLHTATNREDVRSLAISHRGTLLATASTSGNLTLWSAATLQPIASVSAVGILGQPNFSPDDRELIDSLGNSVAIWGVPDLAIVAEHNTMAAAVRMSAISPDGKLIALTTRNTLEVWDRAFSRRILQLPANQPGPISFCPKSDCLVVGNYDSVDLVNVHTGEVRSFEEPWGFGASALVSQDGRHLIYAGMDGAVRTWDMRTGSLLDIFVPEAVAGYVSFFGPQQLLACGNSHRITIWNRIRPFPDMHGDDEIYTLAFAPDNRLLISAGNDGRLSVWDVESRSVLRSIDFGERVEHVVFLTPTEALVIGVRTVSAWDLSTGKEVRRLATSSDSLVAAASPNTSTIVVADQKLRRWQLLDSSTGRMLAGGSLAVSPGRIALAHNGSAFAVIGGEGRVFVWERNGYSAELQGCSFSSHSLEFSPNDRQILAGCDSGGNIFVWDWHRKRIEAVLKGHQEAVKSLTFSPDGTRLITTSDDGSLRIWDTKTWQTILSSDESRVSLETAAFSPDGSLFAVSGDDTFIRVWDISHSGRHPSSAPLPVDEYAHLSPHKRNPQ